jgi:hypothetical protein
LVGFQDLHKKVICASSSSSIFEILVKTFITGIEFLNVAITQDKNCSATIVGTQKKRQSFQENPLIKCHFSFGMNILHTVKPLPLLSLPTSCNNGLGSLFVSMCGIYKQIFRIS